MDKAHENIGFPSTACLCLVPIREQTGWGWGGGGVEVCYKAALYDVVLDALKILHSSVVFHPSGKLIYI